MVVYECDYCILRAFYRLYPFILLDNKKEGPRNFSGGRSPH
jgi:hypothetical protein